jgi:hypothetical protein
MTELRVDDTVESIRDTLHITRTAMEVAFHDNLTLQSHIDRIQRLIDACDRVTSSDLTPALPDDAEAQISVWLVGRFPHSMNGSKHRTAARGVLRMVREWLSSPATDPEPTTPNEPRASCGYHTEAEAQVSIRHELCEPAGPTLGGI